MHGNPYDGHTLEAAIQESEHNSRRTIKRVLVDKGYKGHNINGKHVVLISGQKKGMTKHFKKCLKRRQAIEQAISRNPRPSEMIAKFKNDSGFSRRG